MFLVCIQLESSRKILSNVLRTSPVIESGIGQVQIRELPRASLHQLNGLSTLGKGSGLDSFVLSRATGI